MTDTELVHLTVERGIATVTLDSPHNRNALSRQLVAELTDTLQSAGANPEIRADRAHPHRDNLLRGRRPLRGIDGADDRHGTASPGGAAPHRRCSPACYCQNRR